MAITAIFIIGVLKIQIFFRYESLLVERGGIPAIRIMEGGNDSRCGKGSGVGPPECAMLDCHFTVVIIRMGDMAEKSIHFKSARLLPVPGDELPVCRIPQGSFDRESCRTVERFERNA